MRTYRVLVAALVFVMLGILVLPVSAQYISAEENNKNLVLAYVRAEHDRDFSQLSSLVAEDFALQVSGAMTSQAAIEVGLVDTG